MTRFSLVLAVVLGTVPVAEAQTGGSLQRLWRVVDSGDSVTVTDTFGRDVEGRVIDISASALSLRVRGLRVDLSAAEVSVVRQRHRDSLKNGTLWGLLTGTAVAGIAMQLDQGHPTAELIGLSVAAAAGAGIGAMVDAGIQGNRVVYSAKSDRRVKISPLVSRDRRGVALSLGF